MINLKLRQTFDLYRALIALKPTAFGSAVFFGFFLRCSSVASFLLSLKVFLAIIGYDKFYEIISESYSLSFPFDLTRDSYNYLLIALLVSAVLLQLILANIYPRILQHFLEQCSYQYVKQVDLSERKIRDFIVVNLQTGLENCVKIFEIALFYILLFSIIAMINIKMLLVVLFFALLIISFLVFRNKTEVRLSENLNEIRLTARRDSAMVSRAIKSNVDNISRQCKSLLTPRVLSSVTMALMICLYFLFFSKDGLDPFYAIVLVFSMRFIVIYTGELSRALNVLSKQRILISENYAYLTLSR